MTEQTGNSKPNEAEGLAFLLSGNEKLIEEAAKRLLKDVNPKHGRPASSQLASDIRLVAGAVFERALTPTDDEQEALSQIIKDVSANTPGDLIPQFRRDLIVSKILAADFRRTELQGEPSEGVIRNHGGWDMGLQSKSYPPDSAVDAALTAWNVTGGSDRVAMRAALRAAGVVGQEGESRG